MNVSATTRLTGSTCDGDSTRTEKCGLSGAPPVRATNGIHVSGAIGTARISLWPSQRSIRSSPERRNSSRELATSSGAGCGTSSSTVNVRERIASESAAELIQTQSDTTFDSAEGQTRLVGDLLVRLVAHERAPNEIRLAWRQLVHKSPQELAACNCLELVKCVLGMRVRQPLREVADVLERPRAATPQVIETAVAHHCQEPCSTGAPLRIEAIRFAEQCQKDV